MKSIHVTDYLNLDHLAIQDVCQNYLFDLAVFSVIITTYYFETMQTFCFHLDFPLITLPSWRVPPATIRVWYSISDILCPSLHLQWLIWILLKTCYFFPIEFFIQLFIYFSVDSQMFISFGGLKSNSLPIYFLLKLIKFWPLGTLGSTLVEQQKYHADNILTNE